MEGLIGRIARSVAAPLGLEVYRKTKAEEWREINFMQKLFDILQIDCIFDVGANEGQFAMLLRRTGYKGTILSFEPGPKAFEKLTANSANDDRWHIFNVALGSAEGTLPFNIMKWDLFSSFHAPTQTEKHAYGDVNVVERVVDVPVKTIDGSFAELQKAHRFERPFIKMDTQGFDLEVLKGAGATTGKFLGLMSEVSITTLYEDSPTIVDSIGYFRSAGFDVVGMFSVHPEDILNPVEFNCYAVRRGLSAAS